MNDSLSGPQRTCQGRTTTVCYQSCHSCPSPPTIYSPSPFLSTPARSMRTYVIPHYKYFYLIDSQQMNTPTSFWSLTVEARPSLTPWGNRYCKLLSMDLIGQQIMTSANLLSAKPYFTSIEGLRDGFLSLTVTLHIKISKSWARGPEDKATSINVSHQATKYSGPLSHSYP